MWVCQKCGTFNNDENESCVGCGKARATDQKSSKKGLKYAADKEKQNKKKQSNKKRNLLLFTAMFMVMLAVAAVVISIVALDNQQDRTPEETEVIEAEEEDVVTSDHETLRVATCRDVYETGILEVLGDEFLEDTGILIEFLPVGAQEALLLGREGEVDLVFLNAPTCEELFVEEGHGIERIPVMHNDFVIVGPGDLVGDEVEVAGLLFTLVEVLELPFLSLGDNSGAHQVEMAIWGSLELDPRSNPNYVHSGQGMSETIVRANEEKALTLIDRGIWLTHGRGMELIVLCEGDPILYNPYSIIAVNPAIHLEVNHQMANTFIEWILSDRAQDVIREFGAVQFGEPLFVPGARVVTEEVDANDMNHRDDMDDTNDTDDIDATNDADGIGDTNDIDDTNDADGIGDTNDIDDINDIDE